MKKYKSHTLKEYSDCLSKKAPTPGGGSAAAYTAALGVSLISMVANYSIGRSKSKKIDTKIKTILKKSEKIRKNLLELVDHDAKVYLDVVKSRKKSEKQKSQALKKAAEVPGLVAVLCYEAVDLTPFLVENGNKHLVSDIQVAIELLLSAYQSALINVYINQA